jgi:universal stress protein A
VIPGAPAKVLLEEVRPNSSDWIVLGGHRKRDLLDFGSTMRAVFAKATVPVWIQSHPVHSIERILAPVDLSDESLMALAMACALAKVLHARVHALHCFNLGITVTPGALDYAAYGAAFPTEDVLRAQRAKFESAMQGFDWRGVDPTIEFIEGIPTELILDRARTSDLIVMGTHGRTGLASVVLGGTAYSVLKRSEKPVLVTRHTDREFVLGDPD